MSLTWRSNDGTTWPLDGSEGVLTVDEDEGIFTIPTDLIVDQRVGDGAVLVNSRRSPRRVVLSFLLANDVDNVLTLWRSFFVSLAAGGELDYVGMSGTRTLRHVVLEGPNRSMTGRDIQYRNDDVFTVSLLALDPWWYGPQQSLSGVFGSGTAWDAAIPWDEEIPWDGGDSITITNSGDTSTPVDVVLVGASDSVAFSVGGVGGWTTDHTLGSGAYLTVAGDPDARGPHLGPHGYFPGSDSKVNWTLLTESSQLFDLPKGASSLVFGATGTDGSSAWNAFWRNRYLTP